MKFHVSVFYLNQIITASTNFVFIPDKCLNPFLFGCCSDVDATMLACIAFSCPNLEFMEISMASTAVNRITGYNLCFMLFCFFNIIWHIIELLVRHYYSSQGCSEWWCVWTMHYILCHLEVTPDDLCYDCQRILSNGLALCCDVWKNDKYVKA